MANETTPVNCFTAGSLDPAVNEVDRELGVRKRCYSRWVQDGKLTAFEAEERFNRLALASSALKAFQAQLIEQSQMKLDAPAEVAAG